MANIWYIQVNRHCNNACHFCSNPSNGNNITYEKGVELIDDFINRKYSGVIFTWGEPTLSPDLDRWIEYCNKSNLSCRIISNGMMSSNINYLKKLRDSWLSLIHFSLYSYIPSVHDFLTDTPWSYVKLIKAIQNALKLWIRVQLNCVISKYNQNHLDKTVKFIDKTFPPIRHFVWNNLDPHMMRPTKTALSTLPDYDIAWDSIKRAMSHLEKVWKTFRVERFPLCFMRWFEWASTETRKIVKDEERTVYFLDERATIKDKWLEFTHDYREECLDCDLRPICAWIRKDKEFYSYVKVIPQKLIDKDKQEIIDKIKLK